MSIVDDLRSQITAGKIKFDPPKEFAEKLKKQLLGESTEENATELLQSLVLEISKIENIQISSIVRNEGHHGAGRAFDVGNETIAKSLLPNVATDVKVSELKIDEIIFDAGGANLEERNKFNYNEGRKHLYDDKRLKQHRNHIHFAVIARSSLINTRARISAWHEAKN